MYIYILYILYILIEGKNKQTIELPFTKVKSAEWGYLVWKQGALLRHFTPNHQLVAANTNGHPKHINT